GAAAGRVHRRKAGEILLAWVSTVPCGAALAGLAYLLIGRLDHVYFPRSGVLSATVVLDDGNTAEVAVIGSEGMAGVSAFLGATRSAEQVFCQIPPCDCRKWAAAEFAAEVAKGGP